MGKQQDRSSTPPADGPPPLGGHNGVEPHATWSTQATPTTAGMPSPCTPSAPCSGRGADPGTAAHLVGAAGYLWPTRAHPQAHCSTEAPANTARRPGRLRANDVPRDTRPRHRYHQVFFRFRSCGLLSSGVFVGSPPPLCFIRLVASEGGRDERSRGPVPCGIDPIQCTSAQGCAVVLLICRMRLNK